MIDHNLNSSSYYTRSIRSQSGELADAETVRKVEEAVQNVDAFCPALQKVDEILKQENRQINESIAATLCKRVRSKDDWKLQKLFYQSFGDRQDDPSLFLEMLMKSVEMEDKRFFFTCKARATSVYSQNAEIMKAVALGLTLFEDFISASSALYDLVDKGQATSECMAACIKLFPMELKHRVVMIYRKLREAKITSPEIDEAFERFWRKPQAEKQQNFCELTLNAMASNNLNNVRKYFYKAVQSGQINHPLWESMIDYELRMTEDFSIAKKIYFDSPIQVRLKREEGGFLALDVMGRSWGCAALMLYSTIRDFKYNPSLGKCFTALLGDDIHAQYYLIGFIKENWRDVRVEVQPGSTNRFFIFI